MIRCCLQAKKKEAKEEENQKKDPKELEKELRVRASCSRYTTRSSLSVLRDSQALSEDVLPYDDDAPDANGALMQGRIVRKSLPWLSDWAKGVQQQALALLSKDPYQGMRCKYESVSCAPSLASDHYVWNAQNRSARSGHGRGETATRQYRRLSLRGTKQSKPSDCRGCRRRRSSRRSQRRCRHSKRCTRRSE